MFQVNGKRERQNVPAAPTRIASATLGFMVARESEDVAGGQGDERIEECREGDGGELKLASRSKVGCEER